MNDSFEDSLVTPAPGTYSAASDISRFGPSTPYSEKRGILMKNPTDPDEISTTSGVEYNTRRTGSAQSHRNRAGPTVNRNDELDTDKNLIDDYESFLGDDPPFSSIPVSLILHPTDSQVSCAFLALSPAFRSSQSSTTVTSNLWKSIPIPSLLPFSSLRSLSRDWSTSLHKNLRLT